MVNYRGINGFIWAFNREQDVLNLHRLVIRQNPQRHEALAFNDKYVTKAAQSREAVRCPFSGGMYL